MDAAAGVDSGRDWSRLALPAAVTTTVLSGVLVAAWVALTITMPATVPSDDSTGAELLLAVPLVAMGAIAFLLTARRPDNPVGWLLGASVVGLAFLLVGSDYLYHWLYAQDVPRAFLVPLRLTCSLGLAVGFPFLLVLLPLVFPDGHLLSRRWRPVFWLTASLAVMMVVATVLDPDAIGDGHRGVANPLGVLGAHDFLNLFNGLTPTGGVVYFWGLLALMVAGGVSLRIRYHRADSDLRQQLKWFIAAVAVAVAAMVFAMLTGFSPAGMVAIMIGFVALPLSIGIAVLKYRLYDIDLVINRALLFATMAVFITTVYVAIVVGIGSLVGSSGKANLFLSVVATAIVGAAFQPVLGRARRVANRLVYGNRATPYEVLSDLSEHLVDTYAADDLLPRMARTLAEATGASRVEVRLRVGSEITPGAVWPPDSPPSPSIAVNGQVLPDITGVDYALAVRHQGELLGALTLTKRAGESLSPIEQKLVADLAGQAGLMLKNLGLAASLQARVEELRASRQRLVAAQDAERRRIERNLHDGAQQHLVAIKVKLGILESLTRGERAAELASQVKSDADEALETLRDLARGIYPPLLADQGLVVAMQSQARKAAVPVEVQSEGMSRYPQEIEAAVYFCCLEAIQNIAKYAGASHAFVHLSATDGSVDFEVQDDGVGFDPARTPAGSGLTNMTDRMDALGGTLELTSIVGEGTRVKGSLPIGLPAAPTNQAGS